jgi:hypothetical protein
MAKRLTTVGEHWNRVTRQLDSLQIWWAALNDSSGGLPRMALRGALVMGSGLWTWLRESWLPFGVLVAILSYFIFSRMLGPKIAWGGLNEPGAIESTGVPETDGNADGLRKLEQDFSQWRFFREEEKKKIGILEDRSKHMFRALLGRATEIFVNQMILRLQKLTSPYVIEQECQGNEDHYLISVCSFIKDVSEYSANWPRQGWPPYEATINAADRESQADLDRMGEDRFTSKEMSLMKKRLYARHVLAGTALFLEQHRIHAVNLQMDFVDNPYRMARNFDR